MSFHIELINQFVLLYVRVLIGPHMFSSYTRHKRYEHALEIYASEGKTEAKSWGRKLIN